MSSDVHAVLSARIASVLMGARFKSGTQPAKSRECAKQWVR